MAPFLIGLFIFTAAVTVGPASGGSFNPARSLDPVLYNQDWGDVWIYIVGRPRRRRARCCDLGQPASASAYSSIPSTRCHACELTPHPIRSNGTDERAAFQSHLPAGGALRFTC